jgi:hypothetical protein
MPHHDGASGALLAQRTVSSTDLAVSAGFRHWQAGCFSLGSEDRFVDEDVTSNPPRAIHARFELIATRIADAWITSGELKISVSDLRLAQEFLEQTGYQVQEVPGLLVRLTRDGQSEEMTREKAVLLAMRRLAAQK